MNGANVLSFKFGGLQLFSELSQSPWKKSTLYYRFVFCIFFSRRESKHYMRSKLNFQNWVSYKLMLAWIAGIFQKCENIMVISQDIYNREILYNYIFSHLSMCVNISTDKFTEKKEIYSFTRHLPKDKLHKRSWIFYHFDGLYLKKSN